MKVARTAGELVHPPGARVGFVPTMGAFHEGHLELMRRAKAECGYCVVSLFVNPTQFGKGEDFERYPRDEAGDFELAESAGVDAMFAPSVEAMVGRGETIVRVEGVTSRWEGERRPGHFDGVATIVCKLFHLVRPHSAFFGTKDYQQCVVVRRMVEDLGIGVDLRWVDTVRESDGLALSSRNRYLSSEERSIAPRMYAALVEAKGEFEAAADVEVDEVLERGRNALESAGFQVEYFALADAETLEPLTGPGEGRLLVAAKLGSTRLIDNVGVRLGL